MSREIDNPVLKKLQNRKQAKTFTEEDFEKIADWDNSVSHAGPGVPVYTYNLKNGQTIICNSKSELKLAKYLDVRDLFICCGTQSLCINYETAFSQKNKYYPDFVILTKEYHIAFIEVKALTAMSYHLNLEKYTALEEYCKKHGYEYMMVDPGKNYSTIDQLKRKKITKELEKAFILQGRKKNNKDTLINKETVESWYKQFGGKQRKGIFNIQIHSLIIQKRWYNKYENGFLTYRQPI